MILGVVSYRDEAEDPRIKHSCYRLETVPLARFFVVVVDFLLVDFAGVFELDFVVLLTAVIRLPPVVLAAADLLVVFGADLPAAVGETAFGSGSVAIASIRGAVFLGIAART